MQYAISPAPLTHAVSNEQSVGAGVAEILSAVPHAIVDFTNVARGEGDAEIVVEASMIMGAPRVCFTDGTCAPVVVNDASGAAIAVEASLIMGAPQGHVTGLSILFWLWCGMPHLRFGGAHCQCSCRVLGRPSVHAG
eukprot:1161777-Pelagomonas_calceolata.AAC.6